jgi:hypothetical protein
MGGADPILSWEPHLTPTTALRNHGGPGDDPNARALTRPGPR